MAARRLRRLVEVEVEVCVLLPSPIVRSTDDLVLIVFLPDDLVPFSDDLARFVRRPDDLSGGTVTHTCAPAISPVLSLHAGRNSCIAVDVA